MGTGTVAGRGDGGGCERVEMRDGMGGERDMERLNEDACTER